MWSRKDGERVYSIRRARFAWSVACCLAVATALSPRRAPGAPEPEVSRGGGDRGRQLFLAVGCYQCHGTWGKGSGVAPKLAPEPLLFAAFELQLRSPVGAMPVYTAKVLSQQDVVDIYAYLTHIPPDRAAAEITLLDPPR